MRIFAKSNHKNVPTPRGTSERNIEPTVSVASAVPKYDVNSGVPHKSDEHILPSFQMHQFYINRSLIDAEEDLENIPPPPVPPRAPPCSSRTIPEDAVSILSSDSIHPDCQRRTRRSNSSRRMRNSMGHATRTISNGSTRSQNSHELTEEQMLRNLYYRNINFDSEKESILHNLNMLNHLQNKFIKMKIYVAKDNKVNPRFKQVTDDLLIKEYQQGDEVKGFATVTNNSKSFLKFEMFSTFLFGEVTVVRGIGDKYRQVFLKMVDLESSLLSETEEVDEDGYMVGLPKNKLLTPGTSYKIPFSFVLPNHLLDNSCDNELTDHLRLPPSFGISKDSSGWFGNIPDRGYVCHDLSALHSNTSHYGNNTSKDKLAYNMYMKGGDGIFTNDLCPNGVAISYGIESVLIGSASAPAETNFVIINDAKHQLRVVPHYVDNDNDDDDNDTNVDSGCPTDLVALNASRDNYYSLSGLRKRYEQEITRLETIISQKATSIKESSDDERPSRKVRSLAKEKQLDLAKLNRKLTDETLQTWDSNTQKRAAELRINELKSVQKKFLTQQLKTSDQKVCSIVNFLSKSANNAIVDEIHSINKSNPTIFILDRLNHHFIEHYSKSSFLKISCGHLQFDMIYNTPLKFKIEKNKTIWNMLSEKKKNQAKSNLEHEKLTNPLSNNIQSIRSYNESQNITEPIYKAIELDLEFISIKAHSPSADYQKPPKIKSSKISLCVITVDSKHPIPIKLTADMFVNATNENVDINNSDHFADASRKVFSFSKYNNVGIVHEFRNYKNRLLKISKELEVINGQSGTDDDIVISPSVVKSLNSLLTLRFNKTVIDEEFELKNFRLINQNWETSQQQVGNDTRLMFQNKLSIIIDIGNENIKETLIPSFQSCLIARMYCFKIEMDLEDGNDIGSNGFNKKKAVVYVPVDIK